MSMRNPQGQHGSWSCKIYGHDSKQSMNMCHSWAMGIGDFMALCDSWIDRHDNWCGYMHHSCDQTIHGMLRNF